MNATSPPGPFSADVDTISRTVCLRGHVTGAHRAALTRELLGLLTESDEADVTIDATSVAYLSNSALEVFVAIARLMYSPRRLILRAPPTLDIPRRLTERRWLVDPSLRMTILEE